MQAAWIQTGAEFYLSIPRVIYISASICTYQSETGARKGSENPFADNYNGRRLGHQ